MSHRLRPDIAKHTGAAWPARAQKHRRATDERCTVSLVSRHGVHSASPHEVAA